MHAFDLIVDYNPLEHPSRLVVALDRAQLSANVLSASVGLALKLELRDGSAFLVNKSEKADFAPAALAEASDPTIVSSAASRRVAVPASPFLRHMQGTLVERLERLKFVRVATLDVLTALIKFDVIPLAQKRYVVARRAPP